LLVSIMVFSLLHMLPGDPVIALSGDEHDPAVIDLLRKKYGFDQPVAVQYGLWLRNVLGGDFGISYRNQISVADLIGTKLPVTLELSIFSMIFALVLGIPAGIILALSGISVPTSGSAS
jgi:peptide/nickel transport system permease protein